MNRLAFFFLLALPAAAAAQPSYGAVEDRQTNVPAYFFHVLPGEATIRVYVWGSVGAPGLYEIGADTGLSELLTLTGGPALEPVTEDRIVHTTVRVYRFEGAERRLAYEAEVDAFVHDPGRHPALEDNDLIEVETAIEEVPEPFGWRDAVTVVTGVAAVILAVERIITLF